MFEDLLKKIDTLPPFGRNIIFALAAIIVGLVCKSIATWLVKIYLKSTGPFSLGRSFVRRLSIPVTWLLPILAINATLPFMVLGTYEYLVLDKITSILLIIIFAVVLIALVKVFEDFVLYTYDLSKPDTSRERKIRTQLLFIKRMVISLIVILSVGAILLSFESLRKIGAGLLTGVGVGGIIVGFAAQRSLANLLAGLQIAFTQPISIDDIVFVEGESGKVEEITLTYVVLNIWDQRRLILPINYFIDKPFQNWSRNSADVIGSVFICVDYTAPLDEIRKAFTASVEASELWDKRVAVLQVTDSTENSIQLRMLVSASDTGKAFDLRCFIRESMITFIQKNYPSALPFKRSMSLNQDQSNNNGQHTTDLLG